MRLCYQIKDNKFLSVVNWLSYEADYSTRLLCSMVLLDWVVALLIMLLFWGHFEIYEFELRKTVLLALNYPIYFLINCWVTPENFKALSNAYQKWEQKFNGYIEKKHPVQPCTLLYTFSSTLRQKADRRDPNTLTIWIQRRIWKTYFDGFTVTVLVYFKLLIWLVITEMTMTTTTVLYVP